MTYISRVKNFNPITSAEKKLRETRASNRLQAKIILAFAMDAKPEMNNVKDDVASVSPTPSPILSDWNTSDGGSTKEFIRPLV